MLQTKTPPLRTELKRRSCMTINRYRLIESVVRFPTRAARLWSNLRWGLSSNAAIAERVERQLNLGEHYWLFVLGLNNSGTTLLSRLLQSHPLMRVLPREGQNLTAALPRPVEYGVSRIWGTRLDVFHWDQDCDGSPALRAKYDWAAHYGSQPGILVEKSPPNSVRSRWLQRYFQPSRFVALVRSPYAVCEGICRRNGVDVETAARHWTEANTCLLDDLEHLDRALLVRYEDICAQPHEHLERLSAFLELDVAFDADILTQVKAHSIDGKSVGVQNLNAKSIERLSQDEIDVISRVAGPLLPRLGYESL